MKLLWEREKQIHVETLLNESWSSTVSDQLSQFPSNALRCLLPSLWNVDVVINPSFTSSQSLLSVLQVQYMTDAIRGFPSIPPAIL